MTDREFETTKHHMILIKMILDDATVHAVCKEISLSLTCVHYLVTSSINCSFEKRKRLASIDLY